MTAPMGAFPVSTFPKGPGRVGAWGTRPASPRTHSSPFPSQVAAATLALGRRLYTTSLCEAPTELGTQEASLRPGMAARGADTS